MANSYLVTENSIPHRIPLNGVTVFAWADQVILMHMSRDKQLFHPIYPDQSFLEIVQLRQQTRASDDTA